MEGKDENSNEFYKYKYEINFQDKFQPEVINYK